MLCGELQLYCFGEEMLEANYKNCPGLSEPVEVVAGDVARCAQLVYELATEHGWKVRAGRWLCRRCVAGWDALASKPIEELRKVKR
jgi:hypothetical protein